MTTSARFSGAPNDFWRSGAGATLPDGVADFTDAVEHNGLVGIGTAFATADPIAQLDVAFGARSGVDGRVVGVTPFYATGTLPIIPSVTNGGTITTTPTGGAEFRHSNQLQGIGIGFNGLYATGSTANENMAFLNRGTGQFEFIYQAKGALNLDYFNFESPVAVAVGHGFIQRHWQNGVDYANYYPCFFETIAPISSRQQWDITVNAALITALRLRPVNDGIRTAGAELYVGENTVHSRKIVLFESTATPFGAFSFGIEGSTLLFNVPVAANRFRWAAAGVTAMILNNGATNGRLNLPLLQTFTTDVLAGTGGLVKGDVYVDALGGLHAKL